MAARTRKGQAALLDDKINILDRKAAASSPGTQQVFKTVSGILTLVQVGALVPRPSANSQILDLMGDSTRTR